MKASAMCVGVEGSVVGRLDALLERRHDRSGTLPERVEGIELVEPRELAQRLCEPVFEWIRSLSVSESTRTTYTYGIRRFLRWLESEADRMPLSSTVAEFKSYLQERVAPRTVAVYVASVRAFFRYASSQGIPNLAADVKVKQPRGHSRESLTIDQARALLSSVDTTDLAGKRDYALLALFLATGLRRSEVIGANVGDLREKQGQVVLTIKGKGHAGKDDFVLLTPTVRGAINAWLDARARVKPLNEGDALFTSLSPNNELGRFSHMGLSRIVKARLKVIDLNGGQYTVHTLRHTAAMLLYNATGDVLRTQTLLRHSNIQTTLVYARMADRLGANAPEHDLDRILFTDGDTAQGSAGEHVEGALRQFVN